MERVVAVFVVGAAVAQSAAAQTTPAKQCLEYRPENRVDTADGAFIGRVLSERPSDAGGYLYRFSVVRGGLYSVGELTAVLRSDPIAAAQAAGGGRGGRGSFLPPAGTAPVQLFIQRGSGERKAITNTNYTHISPSVSPDGKYVVFGADKNLRADSLVARERDSVAKLPPNHVRDDADRIFVA